MIALATIQRNFEQLSFTESLVAEVFFAVTIIRYRDLKNLGTLKEKHLLFGLLKCPIYGGLSGCYFYNENF